MAYLMKKVQEMRLLLFDLVNIVQSIPLIEDLQELIYENLEMRFVYLDLYPKFKKKWVFGS
jgi:hypothetical protein